MFSAFSVSFSCGKCLFCLIFDTPCPCCVQKGEGGAGEGNFTHQHLQFHQSLVPLSLQLECYLWKLTGKQQAICTTSTSCCKSSFHRFFTSRKGAIWCCEAKIWVTFVLMMFQEMVDFLVDIWEQEGMYDWLKKKKLEDCIRIHEW